MLRLPERGLILSDVSPDVLGFIRCENTDECGVVFVAHEGRFAGDLNRKCAICEAAISFLEMTAEQTELFYKEHADPKTNTQKEEGN